MKRRNAFVVAIATSLISTAASAQIADHLQCFKIKDSQDKAKYNATLTPGDSAFAAAPGCIIKVPAKYLCVDTVKGAVEPAPPGAPGQQTAAQNYLCYKTKCPKIAKTPWAGRDQFGLRAVRAIKTGLVCAPIAATAATCETATDCPGTDTACQARTCTDGVCGIANEPEGPATSQMNGDCQQIQCDGDGGMTSMVNDADVPPDDGNQCTTSSCLAGSPVQLPVAPATPCTGGVCVGAVCTPTP